MQTSRAIKKEDSRHRILQAASKRLRREGLDGASIATVMNDAGLTHGTFNAHFKNKDELTIEAFKHSLAQSQRHSQARACPGVADCRRCASLRIAGS